MVYLDLPLYGLALSMVNQIGREANHETAELLNHSSIPEVSTNLGYLHHALKVARSVVEGRDNMVEVPEQELEDVLGRIKALEAEVGAILSSADPPSSTFTPEPVEVSESEYDCAGSLTIRDINEVRDPSVIGRDTNCISRAKATGNIIEPNKQPDIVTTSSGKGYEETSDAEHRMPNDNDRQASHQAGAPTRPTFVRSEKPAAVVSESLAATTSISEGKPSDGAPGVFKEAASSNTMDSDAAVSDPVSTEKDSMSSPPGTPPIIPTATADELSPPQTLAPSSVIADIMNSANRATSMVKEKLTTLIFTSTRISRSTQTSTDSSTFYESGVPFVNTTTGVDQGAVVLEDADMKASSSLRASVPALSLPMTPSGLRTMTATKASRSMGV
ncbi:hypothetical protein PT974_05804 [Cladobotryum mycophilum]|uniref:Uncharacterized protein n=1 Tax=Cladobotryum mycophilum TaxID=491253 RepID=A0ABR0SKX2_9HYPO